MTALSACEGSALIDMHALPLGRLRDVHMKFTYLTNTNSHRRSQLESVTQRVNVFMCVLSGNYLINYHVAFANYGSDHGKQYFY